MKQVYDAIEDGRLNSYLNDEKHFQTCDLYELTLQDGSTYYIADYDVALNYKGHVWEHNRGLFSREQTKLTGEPTVDSMTITIACDRDDQVGGVSLMRAAHDGLLSNSQLKLLKGYIDDSGIIIGDIWIFEGGCEVASAGGLKIKLTCKSYVQGLSQNVPTRIFAPQKAYTNANGTVTTSENDTTTMLIPLKPSSRVLVKI